MHKYEPVNLQKKKSDILVIHCSDPRFQETYKEIINHVNKHHALLVLPGASKPVVDKPATLDDIIMLHNLHKFEEIHIFDHIDCGAFGEQDDEKATHSKYLQKASEKIKQVLPGVRVITHLLGQTEEVRV